LMKMATCPIMLLRPGNINTAETLRTLH
jgi:hypothetical protein